MRPPAPDGSLIDHPALAVPVPATSGYRFDLAKPVRLTGLGRGKRLRLAVQLTAATALLAEFDLWPGRRALANATAVETADGLQAVVRGPLMSMSRVFSGLGGGEAAADTARDSIAASVAAATGIDDASATPGGGPGFTLAPQLERLLGSLAKPLDPVTARNLWAARWLVDLDLAPAELLYWNVIDGSLAFRFGAMCWSALRRRGKQAWLVGTGAGGDAGRLPPADAIGSLVVVGRIGREDLQAAGRWVSRSENNALMIGRFPDGWNPPPPPGFDTDRLSMHLAIAGASLERCRKAIDARRGGFDPLKEGDRAALTEAARRLWSVETSPSHRSGSRRLQRLLSLAPEGLPEGFLVVHTGRTPGRLRSEAAGGPVVISNGRWRLPEAVPMGIDPLHAEVAGLFEADDPRRLRHLALADGDPSELIAWARRRLTALDGASVRRVLRPMAPGALGTHVQLLMAEACLSEMDMFGARSALGGLRGDRFRPWNGWLSALDGPPGCELELPSGDEISSAPRPCAEVLRVLFRRAVRNGVGSAPEIRNLLEQCLAGLDGAQRRLMDVETAAIECPRLLSDRSWRRSIVGRVGPILRRVAHLRALQLIEGGRFRAAHRLLRMAAAGERSPARLGLIHLDLGSSELTRGRSRQAADHLLRAHRLLQAAGFRAKTDLVLFDLAVCDLDLLRVERAGMRLAHLESSSPTADEFVFGEKPRLALACGDEKLFRDQLAEFAALVSARDSRFREQLAFLGGVEALLDGDLENARRRLVEGGQEGASWLPLIGALEGRRVRSPESDDWGVGRAAKLILSARSHPAAASREMLPEGDEWTVTDAMAVALAVRFARPPLELGRGLRAAAGSVLASHGLTGWARVLQRHQQHTNDFVEVLADLVDSGRPEAFGGEGVGRLLDALGVRGLEVRLSSAEEPVWRVGCGRRGSELRRGGLKLLPLGGDGTDGSAGWRLLLGILELMMPDVHRLDDGAGGDTGFHGESRVIEQVRVQLRELAPTGVAVLLLGETGVGKEVAASAIHRLSGRPGRMVPVNVAAMPGELLEAELFGSVRGAFTGAERTRTGLADAADRGTLFLDEIGDLDPRLQAKLLRFLETGEVRPVGADRFHRVDVRIVSATHQDLRRKIEEGAFRNDLYYRIASVSIEIPPLRDRAVDVRELREIFEAEAATSHMRRPRRWSREADELLTGYGWPGNTRELRHVVEVAMIRAAGGVVMPWHLPIDSELKVPTGSWDDAVAGFRRRFLTTALQRNRGNRSATARELGISRQALLYHIRNLGLANVR